MRYKYLGPFALVFKLILVMAGVVAVAMLENMPKNSLESYFSEESQPKFEEIQKKYGLVSAQPLAPHGKLLPTALKAELITRSESAKNLGVISKIAKDDTLLRLHPHTPLTEDERAELAAELEALPEITAAEPDMPLILQASPQREAASAEPTQSTEPIETKATWPGIAIIDSGLFQYHEDFDTSKLYKKNHRVVFWNFSENSRKIYDYVGHGSHIAGIIHEQTESPLLILSICKTDAYDCRLSDLIAALEYAKKQDVKIINLSLGITKDSKILEETIEGVSQKNIFIVAGSGNDNTDKKFYPAAYSEAIAVGAVNRKDQKSSISNYGSWIDVSAPGEYIKSYKNAKTGYVYMTGTSQAAAHVTAHIAQLLSTQSFASTDELLETLKGEVLPFAPSETYKDQLGIGIVR